MRRSLESAAGTVDYYSLGLLDDAGLVDLARLPFSIRVLLENMLRHRDGSVAGDDDVQALAGWARMRSPTGRSPSCRPG